MGALKASLPTPLTLVMAVSLRSGVCVSGSHEVGLERKDRVVGSTSVLAWKNESKGRQVVLQEQSLSEGWDPTGHPHSSITAQASICVPRAFRWWEKSNKPNMIEIRSAQELVDVLLTAGDNLVIVDFYSPGCGGCKALHPKICQLAESNPNALFLKVNYQELKPMCQSLNIHVLPFFRFYRGAQGRVCSFSCTIATISKFRDALAKHGTERCSLGPAKGLEESELLSLASNRGTHFSYPLRSSRAGGLTLTDTVSSSSPGFLVGTAEVEERTAAWAVASMQ